MSAAPPTGLITLQKYWTFAYLKDRGCTHVQEGEKNFYFGSDKLANSAEFFKKSHLGEPECPILRIKTSHKCRLFLQKSALHTHQFYFFLMFFCIVLQTKSATKVQKCKSAKAITQQLCFYMHLFVLQACCFRWTQSKKNKTTHKYVPLFFIHCWRLLPLKKEETTTKEKTKQKQNKTRQPLYTETKSDTHLRNTATALNRTPP